MELSESQCDHLTFHITAKVIVPHLSVLILLLRLTVEGLLSSLHLIHVHRLSWWLVVLHSFTPLI